ncbi:hypothetical protein D3C73_1226450 [compost metagenome]
MGVELKAALPQVHIDDINIIHKTGQNGPILPGIGIFLLQDAEPSLQEEQVLHGRIMQVGGNAHTLLLLQLEHQLAEPDQVLRLLLVGQQGGQLLKLPVQLADQLNILK